MDRHGRPIRVLIVDRDPAGRAEIESLLAEDGAWDLEHAATLAEAAAALGRADPAILLVTRVLPDGDGLALIADLRFRRRVAAGVLLTASPSTAEAVLALEAGAVGYLARPLDDPGPLREALFAAGDRVRELVKTERLKERYRLINEELERLRVETNMTSDVIDERVTQARQERREELSECQARNDDLEKALRRERVFLLSLTRRMSFLFSEQPAALRDVLLEVELATRRLAAALDEDGDDDEPNEAG